MKKKILKAIVVILMALIFIALYLINNETSPLSSELLKYDFGSCTGVYKVDANSFFVYLRDSIKFINLHEKWSESLNFSDAIIYHNKNVLGVSDLKTNFIYVYDTNGKLYEIKVPEKLLSFSVNTTGFCSCISKEKNSYKINLYDNSGTKILTYVYSEENIFPINTNISPDGKILAISYIDTNNLNIDSKITFMYTNQNNIFASVQEKNNFIYGLNFLSNNSIILIGDKQIICEKFSPDLKQQWRLNFNDKINMLEIAENFFAVSHSKNSIEFYNMSGKKLGNFESSEQINSISLSNNHALLSTANNIIAVNTKGNYFWSQAIFGEYKFAHFISNPNKVLLVSANKIFLLNVNTKE